jgi:hypothetical protein
VAVGDWQTPSLDPVAQHASEPVGVQLSVPVAFEPLQSTSPGVLGCPPVGTVLLDDTTGCDPGPPLPLDVKEHPATKSPSHATANALDGSRMESIVARERRACPSPISG